MRATPRFRDLGSTMSDRMVQMGGKNAVLSIGCTKRAPLKRNSELTPSIAVATPLKNTITASTLPAPKDKL